MSSLTLPSRRLSRARAVPAAAVLSLALSACGGSDVAAPAPATSATGSAAASDAPADASGQFPLTLDSCGTDVTVPESPERVLLLARADIMRILLDLDEQERVAARAGAFPPEYFPQDYDAVQAIPSLGEDLDDSGHLQISQEAIIAAGPELVVGRPDGIDYDGLADLGIPAVEQPAACPEGIPDIGFDDIDALVGTYGRLFQAEDRAQEVVDGLENRITAVQEAAPGTGRTAAVLYPTVGGGTLYAYGSRSMSHVQLEAAGFTDVFGDTDERVFEVTGEELLARDPDVLVLLHVEGDPAPVEQAVRDLPGASGLSAVTDDQVLVQLFNFGEYPSPLVVDGLENIAEAFGGGRRAAAG